MGTKLIMLLGLFIMYLGYLVLTKRALFLVTIFLWANMYGDEKRFARIFGVLYIAVGVLVIISPFIFGPAHI
ncbi:hypothetical protein JOC34_002781 [Virgibacillus halotolerans]|uniref:hypothetical protein n=1 Tax=Virgibacillus halotolerans TaxID=1071053 RepID=UPI00196175E5|nr:hypothetical protein [Virgibacillus halotolerans]MBM7600390.1 hypothetical protein [Virgibacillus halotolerans]